MSSAPGEPLKSWNTSARRKRERCWKNSRPVHLGKPSSRRQRGVWSGCGDGRAANVEGVLMPAKRISLRVIPLLLILSRVVSAEPLRTDFHGDPLPADAVARLGTVRLRQE